MDTHAAAAELAKKHEEVFGIAPTGVFAAPGRVNLIGEHTDYAGGFVMPAAIDRATVASVSPRNDANIVIHSVNFGETVEFTSETLPTKGSHQWSDYPVGVVSILRGEGIAVPGFSMALYGDVPLGAGLSSSAAIEVATALALLSLGDKTLSGPEIAKLAQRAEVEFVGANVGIMDQFISACGEHDHALLLDCRSLQFRLAPIPSHLSLVIANTMVKHSHAGGEYNIRRAEVEEATAVLRSHRPEVKLLRDATLAELEQCGHEMSPNALKRARHIITDSARAEAAARALEAGDLKELGRLMAAAHASYRDDFEASCKEADIMVELANKQPGLVGARLTGGGFGGCTVNLVEEDKVEAFVKALTSGYKQATGIDAEIYPCHAADGARRIL